METADSFDEFELTSLHHFRKWFYFPEMTGHIPMSSRPYSLVLVLVLILYHQFRWIKHHIGVKNTWLTWCHCDEIKLTCIASRRICATRFHKIEHALCDLPLPESSARIVFSPMTIYRNGKRCCHAKKHQFRFQSKRVKEFLTEIELKPRITNHSRCERVKGAHRLADVQIERKWSGNRNWIWIFPTFAGRAQTRYVPRLVMLFPLLVTFHVFPIEVLPCFRWCHPKQAER